MTHLQQLELRVLELHGTLSLRPTLDVVARVGDILLEAKPLVEHGNWLQWVKRVGLTQRTAQDYMAVSRHLAESKTQPAANITIKQFLNLFREAKRRERLTNRERYRREVAERAGKLPDNITLAHADCRTYRWPEVDAVVTDPPWTDMESYRWLGRFCTTKLKPGGILLVQVGTQQLLDVGGILRDAGLTYHWTLAVVYHATWYCQVYKNWSPGWRPVLLFSRGETGKMPLATDTYTVPPLIAERGKKHHPWEQPLEPWTHWVNRLTPEGALVADPFAGSGTIGVACKLGGRRFVGTEIDRGHYEVAVGRIKGEKEPTGKGEVRGGRTVSAGERP